MSITKQRNEIVKRLDGKLKNNITPNKYPLKIDKPRGYQLKTVEEEKNEYELFCI